MSLVSSALDTFKKSRNDFLTTHTDEYSRLLKYQLKLEDKFSSTTPTGLKFFDLSLQDTMRLLLQRGEYKLSDELRKEFKVPDKRYYYLRLITMAEMDEWLELERFSKAKKSPIGYEVMSILVYLVHFFHHFFLCFSVISHLSMSVFNVKIVMKHKNIYRKFVMKTRLNII